MKKIFVLTADGSEWEVEKEFPKYYLIKSKFSKLIIYKRSIVKRIEREVKHEQQ